MDGFQYPDSALPDESGLKMPPMPMADVGVQQELLELRRKYQELTDQLIAAEEDNVRVSRALLEVKIESNELRQRADAEKEQLLKRILLAENSAAEKAMAMRVKVEDRDATLEKLKKLEGILGEYQALKDNFKRVKQSADAERQRADETGLELLNVVNDKNQLLKQLKALDNDGTDTDTGARLITLEAEKATLLARVTEVEQAFAMRLRAVMEAAEQRDTPRSYRSQNKDKDGPLAKAILEATHTLTRYDARSDVMKEVEALRARISSLTAENQRLQTRSRSGKHASRGDDKSLRGEDHIMGSNARIRDLEDQIASLLTQQAGRSSASGANAALERQLEALTRTNESLRGRVESLTAALEASTARDDSSVESKLQTENSRLTLALQRATDAQKRAETEAETWLTRYQSMLRGGVAKGDESSAQLLHRFEDFSQRTQATLERERSELTTRAVKAETQLEELQERMEQKIRGYQKEIKRLQSELSAASKSSSRRPSSSKHTPGAPRMTNAAARTGNTVPEPGPGPNPSSSSPKVMAHLSFGAPGPSIVGAGGQQGPGPGPEMYATPQQGQYLPQQGAYGQPQQRVSAQGSRR